MKPLAAALAILAALGLHAQRRREQEGFFHTAVPDHRYDLILGRADANAVTATVLAYEPLEGYFSFGGSRTPVLEFAKGEPVSTVLGDLDADRRYSYRLHFRKPGERQFEQSGEHEFHTRRNPGSAFVFAVQADSHLDENTSPATYRQTLANIAGARPDFLIDLGDTFMTDKRRDDFRDALPQYLAQRYYFGLAGHSVPLFLVPGNHDGESGARGDMAEWSLAQRTRFFPNPRSASERENYFAWHWGDALFVALDPFWPTATRTRGDLWRWTLGKPQYEWLRQTLGQSRARFKFVFIHHPIGARTEPIRGGIEAARYGEWGGLDSDGSSGFETHRAGWEMPIHRLLAANKVAAVFHGHDHFYAREELDGIVYQLVPQPGNPRAAAVPRNAAEYGYSQGVLRGGSGYVRVEVSPESAQVDYVAVSKRVEHSYRLKPAVR